MDLIYLIGFATVIMYRTFKAGTHTKALFYRKKYFSSDVTTLEEHLMVGYVFFTICTAVTWPILLPVIGIYKIGQRFNEENSTTNK